MCAVVLGEGQLEQHVLARVEGVERAEQHVVQQRLGRRLLGAVDVDLGFDDRHQTGRQDAPCGVELLCDNGIHATAIGREDHRPHLGAEHAVLLGTLEQGVQARHRLHRLDAVRLLGQAQVDLEEGHHVLAGPEVLGRPEPVDLALHGLLEQDGREDAVTAEDRARHDAGAHRVDEVEHAGLVGCTPTWGCRSAPAPSGCSRRSGRVRRRSPARSGSWSACPGSRCVLSGDAAPRSRWMGHLRPAPSLPLARRPHKDVGHGERPDANRQQPPAAAACTAA